MVELAATLSDHGMHHRSYCIWVHYKTVNVATMQGLTKNEQIYRDSC